MTSKTEDTKAAADEKAERKQTQAEAQAEESAEMQKKTDRAKAKPRAGGSYIDNEPGPIESPDQPPLKVKQFWVIPRDLFDRLTAANEMEAYCEKHGVPWRGGVHQGDITIL